MRSTRNSSIIYSDSISTANVEIFNWTYKSKYTTGNWVGIVQKHPDIIIFLRDPNSNLQNSVGFMEIFKYAGFDCLLPQMNGTFDENGLKEIVQKIESIGYRNSRVLIFCQSTERDWILQYSNSKNLRGIIITNPNMNCLEHEFLNIIPTSSIQKDSLPILIFQGDNDEIVNYHNAIRYYDLISRQTSKRLVLLNAIGHHDLYYSDQFLSNLTSMFPTQLGTSDTLPNIRW